MRWCLAMILTAVPWLADSQPLVDLISANGLVSKGVDRAEISGTLPLQLDTSGHLLVIDPYVIQWRTLTDGQLYAPERSSDERETMRGTGTALTYVTPFSEGRWKLAVAGLCRYNWLGEQSHGEIQYGGVLLVSRVFRPTLTIRAGAYSNYEAFGWFVMPLLGIDWRIDKKHNLYGVLPGTMNYEHKLSPRFHWGVSFRAYTSSYGVRGGDYRRINENPLGLYGDVYMMRHVVLRVEGGWCFVRHVLGGPGDPLYRAEDTTPKGYADHDIADAPYVRMVLAYRLRLDTKP